MLGKPANHFSQSATRRTCRPGLALAGALAFAAGHAFADDVPRGGATIKVGKGDPKITLVLKNTTGQAAHDLTVAVEEGDVKIKCVDIEGTEKDQVDDDGDLRLSSLENDACANPPSDVVKSILSGEAGDPEADREIPDGEERKILIEFDGRTPEGTTITVKFSEKIDEEHYDMLAIPEVDPAAPGEGRAYVSTGARGIATGVINAGAQPIGGLQFWTEPRLEPYINPECIVDRPASVWFDGKVMRVAFETPALPGEQTKLFLKYTEPIRSPGFELVFTASGAVGCYADCDGDGELSFFDFLCFQNAFAGGSPDADCDGDGALTFFDFLCFQDEFSAGCAPADCLPDIRTTVEGAASDPPRIQRTYDLVNRSLHLYGSLSLEETLTSPIEAMLPQTLARLDTLETCTGLPTDIVAIEQALFALADAAGGAPLAELLTMKPGSGGDLAEAIARLHDLGIEFPALAATAEEAERRAELLPRVLDLAGGLKVSDLLFRAHDELPGEVADAARVGVLLGFWGWLWGDNDRCCAKGAGPLVGGFKTDACFSRDAWTWCNKPPPSKVTCSVGSDACP